LEGIKVYFEKDPYANVPAQKPTGVELDTGDDVDQDVAQGTSFDAPFNPPQVAEMCAPPPPAGIKFVVGGKKVLKEIAPRMTPIFETDVNLVTSGERNITDILTDVRAIRGITIVNIEEGGTEKYTQTTDRTRLAIKFVKGGYSLSHVVRALVREITKVAGVIRIRIIKTRRVER
jgi:hypothetical protein